jgi:hypothetical protein
MLVVAAVATLGIGIASSVAGPREFKDLSEEGGHGGEVEESEPDSEGAEEEAPVEEGN